MKRMCALLALTILRVASAQPELDLSFGEGKTETVRIAGVPITFFEQGSGQTLVFYHPSVDFRYWQFAIGRASQEFRTVALPRNNIVPSAAPTDPSGLASFLDQIADGPVHLVSHSMGARQALELAIARPDKLLSLTVIEPALAPDPPSVAALAAAMDASPAECGLADVEETERAMCTLNARINEPGFFGHAPDSLVQILKESARREAALLATLGLQGADPASAPPIAAEPICNDLGALRMPILFVRGELTPAPIQKSLDAYERCLPEHASAKIPGAAHYPHVLSAADFNSVLMRFLREL